jgi:hypothetical protein
MNNMKPLLKLIAHLFSDDRFEWKVLAISVFVISVAIAIHIAAPGISIFLKLYETL